MFNSIIKKLANGNNLTEQDAIYALEMIMDNKATDAQIGAFLMALRLKGETVDEITGCAKVMRNKSSKINHNFENCIDTCGTGGDKTGTFNISTVSAIIAASGGAIITKHGNRSVSSNCGSADILEALGLKITLTPEEVEKCLHETGFCFMFAPYFHKSMKNVAGPRKELGVRSIFNILGPLTNPANASCQIIGVFDKQLTQVMANVLLKLGVKRAMVVHGEDGLDEITITGKTYISELKEGEVKNYTLNPKKYGIDYTTLNELKGGDKEENKKIILDILNGKIGPQRDIVVINTAAALYVGQVVESIQDGIKYAEELIDSKRALKKLEELIKVTNKF